MAGFKRVRIFYGVNEGRYDQTFDEEKATIVERALFDAESKGALAAHFTLGDEEYWLRTDKYLYWTVNNNYEHPPY